MAEKETNATCGKRSNVHKSELEEITECCICLDKYNDPRILPCVHTFCLGCLQASALKSNKNPGDKMPCPVCRKPFVITRKGLSGLKKNFFMSRLIEVLQIPSLVASLRGVSLDVNDQNVERQANVEAPPATNLCTNGLNEECSSNAAAGNRLNSGDTMKNPLLLNQCMQHDGEQMRLYCIDCDELTCVLCFIDGHQSHKCKDVKEAADQFRQQLQKYVETLEDYEGDAVTKTGCIADEKKRLLDDVSNVERLISLRIQLLKDLIDKHAASLLDDLTLIKQRRLKEIDEELKDLSRHRASLESLKKHCSEFKSKASSSDVCRHFKNLSRKVDDLQKLHDPLIDHQMLMFRVSFSVTDIEDILPTDVDSVLGKIEETALEKVCIAIGTCDGMKDITNHVTLISLELNAGSQSLDVVRHRDLPSLPTPCMQPEAAAAIKGDGNSFYIVGVGEKFDEIWKYDFDSGWAQCHHLVEGRSRHCVSFTGSMLYIFGGAANDSVLCSIEGYDALTNTCRRVGDLVEGVECAACVNYKGSIYVFGGAKGNGDSTKAIQVLDVANNSCVLLARSMPRALSLLRAEVWKSFAVLIGPVDSYLYNFEAQCFHDRNQFQVGLIHSGLILMDDRIFVIGGGVDEQDTSGRVIWKCTNEVRSTSLRSFVKDDPPDWKVHAQLPRSSFVDAYVGLRLPSDWK